MQKGAIRMRALRLEIREEVATHLASARNANHRRVRDGLPGPQRQITFHPCGRVAIGHFAASHGVFEPEK